MSKIKYLLVIFFTISFGYANEKSHENILLKIGYMYNNIFTTKKESKIGAKLWNKEMKSRGFNADLIKIEKDEEALDLYERKKIHSLVSDGLFYYKHKKKIDELTDYKWVMSRSNKKFNQYYLVKNRKSNFSFKNFKNQKIFYKDQMSKVWFEYLLLKKGIKTNKILLKMEKVKKDKNLIYNSFFNENSVSVIPKDLYDSMYNLNPQIGKEIEVITASDAIFFNAMGFTRKDLDNNIKVKLDLLGSEVREDKNELKTFSFVKIQNVFTLQKDDLNETDKFFEEYSELKNQ